MELETLAALGLARASNRDRCSWSVNLGPMPRRKPAFYRHFRRGPLPETHLGKRLGSLAEPQRRPLAAFSAFPVSECPG